MNKTFLAITLVLLGIVVVIIAGISVSQLLRHAPSTTGTNQQNPFGGLGGNTSSTTQGGPTIQIRETDGTIATVPDMTKGKPSVTQKSGTYYNVSQDATGNEQASDYAIVYGTDSTISIGLLAEPLSLSRTHAEAALRTLFPLNNDKLCRLSVTVQVPPSVNEAYAGRELGLSFCQGSVPLP